MASYYDEYIKNNQKVIDAQKKAYQTTRDSGNQIAAEKLAADNAALEESFGMQITDTEDTYESALKKNEVQRVLNERQIERRMAEMGLTDSGLNRTQSTAVQLSYANQKGDLIRQRQKAVDTLYAAMRSGQAQNKLTYDASKAQNDATYESDMANLDAQVAANASDYEAKMKQADIDAENARIKGPAVTNTDLTKKQNDYDQLVNAVNRGLYTNEKKLYDAITGYLSDYNPSDTEYFNLLYDLGVNQEAYENYLNAVDSGQGYVGTTAVNYLTSGKQEYKFVVKKDTLNGGWGVDNNDVVDIYYPDGRLLASDVEISELGLKRDDGISISNKVHTDKKHSNNVGNEFTFSVDLKNLKDGKTYNY